MSEEIKLQRDYLIIKLRSLNTMESIDKFVPLIIKELNNLKTN